jgi:hypothetical protein
MSSWNGASLIKARDNFTFYVALRIQDIYIYIYIYIYVYVTLKNLNLVATSSYSESYSHLSTAYEEVLPSKDWKLLQLLVRKGQDDAESVT